MSPDSQIREAKEVARIFRWNSLSHLWSFDVDSEKISLDLHGDVRVGQTTIDLESFQRHSTILLHGIENDLGLETD